MTQNPTNYRQIFLVDDDQEDRELFSEALSGTNQSIKLTEIPSGVKLIEILSKDNSVMPEVIFMDINMPKLNGIECLKKIRSISKFKDLKIVIYSTYYLDDFIEDAFKFGACIFYVKPRSFTGLQSLITEALQVNWPEIGEPDKKDFLKIFSA